jgi:fluoroquinolone transport system ATP-binding protein
VPAAVIEVSGLRYRYPGAQRDTLDGLDFHVAAGEIFGFLGPSGAGKSTAQKVLTGLLPGYGGAGHVFGAPSAAHGPAFYDRIGVGFEVPNLYGKLTGRENLDFFAGLHGTRSVDSGALLDRFGLSDAADRRVAAYSKGMRLRLNLCRALLHRPELLFLDEPTTGQDPYHARLIKDALREQKAAGATIFLTTHDMAVAAELCDRVAFLVDGRLMLIDTPRNLMVEWGARVVRIGFRADGNTAYRDIPLDGLHEDGEFLALLREGRIDTMHTLDATLEDVFLRVTGRALA